MFLCDLCGYLVQESLKTHLELHHPQTVVSFPPPPTHDVASTFWQPWMNKHGERKRTESLEEPQSEPVIKKTKFSHQNDVNNRESNPEPEPQKKKMKCPHCSLSVSSRGSLYNHIKLKHQEGQRWSCDQCGKKIPQKRLFSKTCSQMCRTSHQSEIKNEY